MPDPMQEMREEPDPASENADACYQGEEKRSGVRDRRITDRDRRNPERTADEIAPRRHPDIKGRRSYDG